MSHVLSLVQDTFFRYLKSPVYKDTQKNALSPAPHNFRLVALHTLQNLLKYLCNVLAAV